MRGLERRLEALESSPDGSAFLVILQEKGEAEEDVVPRWERENGSIGNRHALVVTFVDARL